jgi:hypothetical protein
MRLDDPAMLSMIAMMERVAERTATYSDELQPFMADFFREQEMVEARGMVERFRFQSYQALLLEQGTLRHQDFFVPDHPVLAEAEVQQCYLNCYNAVFELGEGWTYVEGLARTNLLLVRHAWLEDPDGMIVDPTWANHLDHAVFGYVTPTYYGVKFSAEFLLEHSARTNWCSMFHAEYEDKPDYPSLRYGFVLDESGRAVGYDRKETA